MRKLLCIYVFLFLLAAPAWSQVDNHAPDTLRPTAALSRNKILIGEQVYLTLTVPAALAGQSITWPVLHDTLNRYIEILDSVVDVKSASDVLTKKYLITSFDSGYYALPPFRFNIDGVLAETNALLLEVHTIDVDTTKGIKDIKEIRPETYSYTFKDYVSWLTEHWYFVAGALAVIAVLIYYFIRKRKNKPVVATEPEVVVPLHEQLLKQLDELEARQLWQNSQVKQYCVDLTDLLRAYVEKRFKVKALEQTTVQLIDNLKTSSIHPEALMVLRNILELADMVKFAKARPTDYENTALMDHARHFALMTKVAEEPQNG